MTVPNRGYDHDREQLGRLLDESQPYVKQGRRCAAFQTTKGGDPSKRMPIDNQGSWPSCGGHALSTAAEYLYYLQTGDIVKLSRMFAWVEAQRVHGRPTKNNGVTIYALIKVIKEIGVPLEEHAEYKVGNWYDKFSPEAMGDASTRKAAHSYDLKDADEVFDFQEAGMGAVIWGVPWDGGGWHAVTTYGPTINEELPGDNSWGPNWDDDGRFEWSRNKVEKYLKTRGVVCIGISDLSTPQVRQGENWLDAGVLG